MGYLNLKNLTIRGNPSLLIKNKVSRNTVALLAYLRDRLPGDSSELEWEVADINKRLSGKAEKKRKEDIPEYEFNDPFKSRVDKYNRNEYNKHLKPGDFSKDAKDHMKTVEDRNNFGISERERYGGQQDTGGFGHGRHRHHQKQTVRN